LLRLLLPLSDKTHSHFFECNLAIASQCLKYSPDHSIGRSDGRCVQRAGTYSEQIDDIHLLGIPR